MKINLKNTKGITLISLIITIVVLIILVGVAIATLTGENGIITKAREAKEKTEQASKEEQGAIDSMLGEIDESLNPQFNETEGVNKPMLTEGMIPVKFNGTNWVICSETDADWYDYENKNWANIMLSDGTYKDGVNATVGQVVEDSELGSMFVWIPRYAYSITEYKTAKDGEGTTQNITDVSFLVGATNRDNNGTNYAVDYNTEDAKQGEATPKIVHPAFTFDGKQLTGIWSAKFEASMAEENNNTVENNNDASKTVKILPNVNTWRYIQVGNCFISCLNMKDNNIYGLTSNADTHLMKNMEWGAVTYLTVSQYGVTPTKNTAVTTEDAEANKYTLLSSGGNYRDNIIQSTTGNESGIYDMNGGAWEYVAAYYDNTNSNITKYGTTTVFDSATKKLKSEYEKYWDKYEVSETEIIEMNNGLWDKNNEYNDIRQSITQDRFNLMSSIKGDAMYEITDKFSYYGQNSDNSSYIWINPFDGDASHASSYYNNDFVLI